MSDLESQLEVSNFNKNEIKALSSIDEELPNDGYKKSPKIGAITFSRIFCCLCNLRSSIKNQANFENFNGLENDIFDDIDDEVFLHKTPTTVLSE